MMDGVQRDPNQQQKSSVLGFVLLIILVGLLVFGIYKLFSSAAPQVAAAIVAGSATVLVSVLSLILSRRWERQRDLEQEIRQKKIPIYEDFMEFWFRLFHGGKAGVNPPTVEEITKFFITFPEKLIIWGPDELIKGYAEFRRQHFMVPIENPPPEKVREMLLDFEKLLYTLRIDIGHKNEKLRPTDLLSLFMTDIEELGINGATPSAPAGTETVIPLHDGARKET